MRDSGERWRVFTQEPLTPKQTLPCSYPDWYKVSAWRIEKFGELTVLQDIIMSKRRAERKVQEEEERKEAERLAKLEAEGSEKRSAEARSKRLAEEEALRIARENETPEERELRESEEAFALVKTQFKEAKEKEAKDENAGDAEGEGLS